MRSLLCSVLYARAAVDGGRLSSHDKWLDKIYILGAGALANKLFVSKFSYRSDTVSKFACVFGIVVELDTDVKYKKCCCVS